MTSLTKTFKERDDGEDIKVLDILECLRLTLRDLLHHLLGNLFLHRMNRLLGEKSLKCVYQSIAGNIPFDVLCFEETLEISIQVAF